MERPGLYTLQPQSCGFSSHSPGIHPEPCNSDKSRPSRQTLVGEDAGLPLHRFSLADTAEAHRAVEGGAVGKVVIDL